MHTNTETNLSSELFIDDGGAGSSVPLVFIHSLAGNSQQWAAQLKHVRQTRRAVAVDLRGHGRSPALTTNDLTINSLAAEVQAVVDKLDLQTFVLIGHSLGGSVATAFAGAHPERVAGLLLVDPSGDSTQLPAAERQQFMGALASEAYSNVVEGYWQQLLTGAAAATQTAVMQDLRRTSKETVVNALTALFQFKPAPALSRYTGPKLSIITPFNDVPFAMHNLVSDLPHKIVSGTGHWLQMDKPAEFNQLLDDFLTSVDPD